jgi:glycerol-3-phosphate O-acyltransferase/dihydroxyacetone phosphate acyltransferase
MSEETSRPAQRGATSPAIPRDLAPISNWKYDTFLWTMSVLVDFFFREMHPRGAWKVPRHGPVLFVAAPHANQVGSHALPCYPLC